jgi:hypothetical protein
MRVTENLRGETILLPRVVPDRGQLTLISFVTLSSESEIIAAVVEYDDPRTKRSVDYRELYDGSGALLLVSWVDEFGIRRTVVDHGLLEEEASELAGVLILLPEGTPL